MKTLESALETKICRAVKMYKGYAFKWVSPGCSGVPDRICLFPGGRVVFVELKRPGRTGGQSPRQAKIERLLKDLGFTVWLINDYDEFLRRLQNEVFPLSLSERG